MGEQHPATAVPADTHAIHGLSGGHTGLDEADVLIPSVGDHRTAREAANRDQHMNLRALFGQKS